MPLIHTANAIIASMASAHHTVNNLDLVFHRGLHVVWMEDDTCNYNDLVRNTILGLHAWDVRDCILVKGMTQKTSFVT
jgi:hypothetical protein